MRKLAHCVLFGSFFFGLFLSSAIAIAQSVPAELKPQQAPQAGAVSTGGVYAPVLDTQKRPITAGGFVESGPIVFQDIAGKAGLSKWHHISGSPEKKFILETVGSGVALLDYDNDGWLDIYLVNGSTFDALTGKATSPHAALFHTITTARSRTLQRKLGSQTIVG